MRRSILGIAFVKKTLRRFRFPLPYLPPLQGYNRWGRASQAKAWAKFPRPFGPTRRLVRRFVRDVLRLVRRSFSEGGSLLQCWVDGQRVTKSDNADDGATCPP